MGKLCRWFELPSVRRLLLPPLRYAFWIGEQHQNFLQPSILCGVKKSCCPGSEGLECTAKIVLDKDQAIWKRQRERAFLSHCLLFSAPSLSKLHRVLFLFGRRGERGDKAEKGGRSKGKRPFGTSKGPEWLPVHSRFDSCRSNQFEGGVQCK